MWRKYDTSVFFATRLMIDDNLHVIYKIHWCVRPHKNTVANIAYLQCIVKMINVLTINGYLHNQVETK